MSGRRSVRKWIWWGSGILIIAIITTVVVLAVKNNNADESKNEQNTSAQAEEISEKKTEEEKQAEKTEEEEEEEKVRAKQYDGGDPNKAETLTGVISYAGVSGENLIVRVNIDQFLSAGSCKLSLTRDGAIIYNDVVGIESSVATSTCDGFVIPAAGLGSGALEIEIELESDGKYGKMTGEVNV